MTPTTALHIKRSFSIPVPNDDAASFDVIHFDVIGSCRRADLLAGPPDVHTPDYKRPWSCTHTGTGSVYLERLLRDGSVFLSRFISSSRVLCFGAKLFRRRRALPWTRYWTTNQKNQPRSRNNVSSRGISGTNLHAATRGSSRPTTNRMMKIRKLPVHRALLLQS